VEGGFLVAFDCPAASAHGRQQTAQRAMTVGGAKLGIMGSAARGISDGRKSGRKVMLGHGMAFSLEKTKQSSFFYEIL
jgi:hypothetical protein